MRTDGRKVILATTKADVYAVQILKHFKIYEYFNFLSCATLDGSRINKEEIIAYALNKAGISDIHHAVMVGDRKFDILGAKRNRIASVAVGYGFGSREELLAANSDYFVSSVEELSTILL